MSHTVQHCGMALGKIDQASVRGGVSELRHVRHDGVLPCPRVQQAQAACLGTSCDSRRNTPNTQVNEAPGTHPALVVGLLQGGDLAVQGVAHV